jgi:hypothetical protein
MKHVYLVCTGDCESHGVEGAYSNETKAIWEASKLAVDSRYDFEASDDYGKYEIALLERDDPMYKGRAFGYISIEKHEIVE